MKIAIVICKYGKNGAGTYFDTLWKALKSYITPNTDLFIYKNSELTNKDYANIEELGYKCCEPTQEYIDELNTYDIVISGYHICYKNVGETAAREYCDFLSKHIYKPKKVIVFNERKFGSIVYNYGYDYIANKEFICSFDGLMLFGRNIETANKFKKLIGEQEFDRLYIDLFHPYFMDEKKTNWVNAKDKMKSIQYLSRTHEIKHPEMMLPLRKVLDDSWIVECRGMKRGFSLFKIPDVAFLFENGKMTKEPSPYTRWVTLKYLKKTLNIDCDDRKTVRMGIANEVGDADKVWIYGEYDKNTIYDIVKYALYACDFYELPTPDDYAKQSIEYCQAEFIDNGIIPIYNYDFGENTYLIENGEITDKKFLDYETGIYLKRDMSNLEEVKDKITYLANNPDKYEEFREKCWNYWKNHTDPKFIVEKLIKDIFAK